MSSSRCGGRIQELGLLLGEAADVFEDDAQLRALVEEARVQAKSCKPELEEQDGGPSISTIATLIFQFIPPLVDSILASGKLLRNDPKTAILGLSKALPFLECLLVELAFTDEGDFRYKAPKIIFNKGMFDPYHKSTSATYLMWNFAALKDWMFCLMREFEPVLQVYCLYIVPSFGKYAFFPRRIGLCGLPAEAHRCARSAMRRRAALISPV